MVRPDLIVLDLGLPDMTGMEVLQHIREWSQVPIIILTAQDQEQDKVAALDQRSRRLCHEAIWHG